MLKNILGIINGYNQMNQYGEYFKKVFLFNQLKTFKYENNVDIIL